MPFLFIDQLVIQAPQSTGGAEGGAHARPNRRVRSMAGGEMIRFWKVCLLVTAGCLPIDDATAQAPSGGLPSNDQINWDSKTPNARIFQTWRIAPATPRTRLRNSTAIRSGTFPSPHCPQRASARSSPPPGDRLRQRSRRLHWSNRQRRSSKNRSRSIRRSRWSAQFSAVLKTLLFFSMKQRKRSSVSILAKRTPDGLFNRSPCGQRRSRRMGSRSRWHCLRRVRNSRQAPWGKQQRLRRRHHQA